MDATIPYPPGTYNWTSGYGPRIDPLGRGSGFHGGVDIAPKQPGLKLPTGSIIPGRITVPGFEAGGAGNNVWIISGRWWWKNFHLDRIDVRTGQDVAAGEHVGIMGTTGASTGVHGHIELWLDGVRVDPTQYLRAAEAAGRFYGEQILIPSVPQPSSEDEVTDAEIEKVAQRVVQLLGANANGDNPHSIAAVQEQVGAAANKTIDAVNIAADRVVRRLGENADGDNAYNIAEVMLRVDKP